tara:strand:+ start:511 stop:957 length:447 start_codon:yes stop_codon:yes gene_type:complete
MDASQTALQGYLEKTGLSISEAESAVEASYSWHAPSYLERVAGYIQQIGKKNAKYEAAKDALTCGILDDDVNKNFILIKANFAVYAYHFGKESDFDFLVNAFTNELDFIAERCASILEDTEKISELKEQFMTSRILGSRKGPWSKFFG